MVFYEILNQLSGKPMSKENLVDELENNSKECVSVNLFYLEKIGFIEYNNGKYTIIPKIKKLLTKTK
ncbi:hypothetical protein HY745_02570 [Candidatus Desantisbacteria bacterium]|nr:hypothetical protein [Candidatus Desantisbacteria bacterium]